MQQVDWLPNRRARTEWVTWRGKVKYSFIGGPVVTASSVLEGGGHTLDEKGLEPHIGVHRGPVKAKGEGHVGASGLCCFPGRGRQNRTEWDGRGRGRLELSIQLGHLLLKPQCLQPPDCAALFKGRTQERRNVGGRRGSGDRNARSREKARSLQGWSRDGAVLAKRWATATLGLP